MSRTLQEFKADILRTLGNPIRIRIFEELRAAESLTVSELQRRIEIESSNLSQHLAALRSRSLVSAQREGTSIRYSVTDASVFEILDAARRLFENQLVHQRELLAEPDQL
jgi:DNA-binding transcriptional ArsR family regulator